MKINNKCLFSLLIIISLLFTLSGCSQNSNVKTSPNVPEHISVKSISKENLSPWKITLHPYKKANQWICNIKVTNKSSATLNNVSYTIGGATVTGGNGTVNPNSTAYSTKGYLLEQNKKINISLEWRSNGKDFKGKAVYEVK